jgi:hypothetical protein
MENTDLKDLAICAVKSNLDKFEKGGYQRYSLNKGDFSIRIDLWNRKKSRGIKIYKSFLGYKFLWDSYSEHYTEDETEIITYHKKEETRFSIQGSELFDLVKNTVEGKTLKQQKKQLEKLCNNQQH